MRNFVMILLIAGTLGTLPAAAQIVFSERARQFSSVVPIVYSGPYGHWRQCADVTGMCGVGVG